MEYSTSPSFYNTSNKKNNLYYNTEMGESNLKDKMRKYSQDIRIKTKRNGSYKPPTKINDLFVDVNEEDSKYYKLNYPKTNTKADKNNNFLKRLRYSIPISNLTKSRYDEYNELTNNNNEDKRSKLIAKLIYSSELRYAQDFQKKAEEESESKEYKIMKDRIEVLKKNNIDVKNLFEENEKKKSENNNVNNEVNKENSNINNKEDNKDENVQFEHLISEDENDVNNKYYNTYTNINKNKLSYSQKKSLSLKEKEQKNSKVNQKRKPIVNSFEFYIKIKDYIRNKVKNSNEKENQNNNFKTAKNSYRNNSFPEREKNKNSINDEININSNDNYYYTDFAFNNRNNKREKKELQKFIKEKEEIRKKSADKLKKEENNRCLHNYLNFANLQKSIDKKKNRILLLKQNKKVKNRYYVGNIPRQNLSYRGNQNSNLNDNYYMNEMINKKNKSANREGYESNKEMTKENYDNFINIQEDRIKKGDFIYDNNEKNKEDKNMNNENSFEKQIIKPKNAVLKNQEIVRQNNLNKFLVNENDNDKNNEIKKD